MAGKPVSRDVGRRGGNRRAHLNLGWCPPRVPYFIGCSLQLGGSEIAPVDNVRLLGIWLDKRLCWTAHIRALRGKMASQMLALTRLAASVWPVM